MSRTQKEEHIGLTTTEALNQLYNDIEQVLSHYEGTHKSKQFKSFVCDVMHHKSKHSALCWTSIVGIFLSAMSLVVSCASDDAAPSLLHESLLIILMLLANAVIVVYDSKLRQVEVPLRVRHVLNQIKTAAANNSWTTENFPHLCSPFSPCITLQWTYRDNKIVNLPWALLVKNDIVVIRAGQISPGYCEALVKGDEYNILHSKQVYGPSLKNANEAISTPKMRKPLENKKYRLIETPYITNLKMALEQALDKPVTHADKQRHLIMIKCLEQFVFPFFLVVTIIICFVRHFYLGKFFGSGHWTEMFLVIPVCVTLPLLPLVFPVVWIVLNCLGNARLRTLFDHSYSIRRRKSNLFEDADFLSTGYIEPRYSWSDLWRNFALVSRGTGHIMTRSANILHVLGSVTALCCVDKKGILSWPNPTAEKVFFLRNATASSCCSSLENVNDLNADTDSLEARTCAGNTMSQYSEHAIGEVLDLTHDQQDPFKLHFDDPDWSQYMSSLKPLGLAILLNTCNIDTQEHYSHFCSHITCEAMYNEHLVPVTNRRCLCELAKQIGFSDHAQEIFKLEQQLSTFRHLQPETVRRDSKFARSLQLSTKLKFPFPHMVAVVVKELSSGTHQLLSQGTADIIVDSCVDYWDGHDLCSLTPTDRKKIQDFYQRTSLTSYCTAFAYRPLSKGCNDKLSQVYLELPSDCKQLFRGNRSPTPIRWNCRTVLEPKFKGTIGQFYSTDSLLYTDNCASEGSRLENSFEVQCNQVFIGMVTMQYQAQADMVHLIEQLERACIRFVHFSKENELRSRVFSEKMGLESGWNCHISLLSERSRSSDQLQRSDTKNDFSKFTRESGPVECWANNGTARVCSPGSMPHRKPGSSPATKSADFRRLNDDSNLESFRALSYSAPSAINLEHSVVKFESGVHHHHRQQDRRDESVHDSGEGCDIASSEDSVESDELLQHTSATENSISPHEQWQSLSCLTDSTEQSAPVNFDMSNRAKLPRGIDKIRPHIEQIDNVPLLVSLFTDCTPSVIREMLHIMQDFGEVVCVMCSSANADNMGICMQADVSIAVEPLYPQVCQKEPVYNHCDSFPSPIELSRALNSVSCPLSVRREDPFSIYHLIMLARHHMLCTWNALQFWVCCCISLSLMQLSCVLLMLPPLLRVGNILWLCLLVVPALSVSLMGLPTDMSVMKKPLGKYHRHVTTEISIFVMWCYGAKFLPTIVAVVLTYAASLTSFCTDICASSNCTCPFMMDVPNETEQASEITWAGWSEHSYSMLSAQQLALLVMVLNFLAISVSFVNRDHNIWVKLPTNNRVWIIVLVSLLILHSIYISASIVSEQRLDQLGFSDISCYVFIFATLSPVLTFAIVELIKSREIKVNLRYQRRARLDFGTKLGMNSPF